MTIDEGVDSRASSRGIPACGIAHDHAGEVLLNRSRNRVCRGRHRLG
jgi:hypothetical protein